MARDVIARCPVGQGGLTVTRVHCRSCGTALEGEFGVGRFGRLEREQLTFLESFLRSRGNLKEMERELGISYPTVRSRLEVLLRALGLGDGSPAPVLDEGAESLPGEPAQSDEDLAAERRAILERLSRHELSADDAATAIRA